ncbi:MAG: pyridoxal 5'-phosphate synthase glutaminase subunit PdxT [Chloroflexota bacterium]
MDGTAPRIGVLALQGGVREHVEMLRAVASVTVVEVTEPADLEGLDGIVLPGGESTTIANLLAESGLLDPLRDSLAHGLPAYGTCAGMILLAGKVTDGAIKGVAAMDITVRRNAFGAQRDSFEADMMVEGLNEGAFRAVFIRAPRIEEAGPDVEILARLPDGTPVAARQGNLLVSAFHPELGRDPRFHAMFLAGCSGKNGSEFA